MRADFGDDGGGVKRAPSESLIGGQAVNGSGKIGRGEGVAGTGALDGWAEKG